MYKGYREYVREKTGKAKTASVSLFLVFVFELTARSESKQLFLQHCQWPLCRGAAREVHQKAVLL